ncbi:MAG: hypothetical protein IKA64_05005 [Clostridia bacterium]|nr:hypothetical protein [Clostridia bacterium]
MYKKWLGALYSLNIIFQSFFSLVFPAGLALGIAYLSVTHLGAPRWLYAPLITVGVGAGLVSMVRFIITSMNALSRLESEQAEADRERREAKRKDEQRRAEFKENGDADI